MPRLFTLEAALALLPRVRELMARTQQQRQDYLAAERQLADAVQTVRGNGQRADTLRQAQEAAARALRQAQQTVETLQDLGCEVKDLEMGLVDFRSLREGREVYLCWRVGEETISYWHELDAGFGGRQPPRLGAVDTSRSLPLAREAGTDKESRYHDAARSSHPVSGY